MIFSEGKWRDNFVDSEHASFSERSSFCYAVGLDFQVFMD